MLNTAPRTTRPRTTRRAVARRVRKAVSKGLSFVRAFATEGVSPYDQLTWERRTAAITDDTGKSIFKQENIEVPASWSALATKIAVSKYFYGDASMGTDPTTGGRETSVRQLVDRVVDTIAAFGVKDGYFKSDADAQAFADDLKWLCVNQFGAFNSPVWFNVGLHQKYGIGKDAGQGNFFYNRETGQAERTPNHYEYPQASACFIQGVKDTMDDILALATSEAMLFKFGSGTGTDLSPIRSTREKLTGGGRPSGPLSFLKIYDQVAGAVKSGGKTRRAAKMNIIKDWHPDVEEFIDAKLNEEKKAWALIDAGYDGSFNGEAYGSVAFQNENLSIRVSDEFMNAAIEGREWWTKNVRDGQPCEKKDASTLLRKIAEGTHLCGDPGMQFDSTIHGWHTCAGTDRQHATNPCSEYLFLNDTACNLASLNLLKFKNADGSFNVEGFKAACRVFITAQEILVDNASYPTKEIAENSHIFRTLGLGFANLGALIMSYGLGYDSNEGRALAGAITAVMTGEAYFQSSVIASQVGPFDGYLDARCSGVDKPLAKDNVASMLAVIERHRNAVSSIQVSERFASLKDAAAVAWDAALANGRKHGYRNAQVTVLAPTGTIGFLMDCDTTGIEPDIALVKYKLLAGGGVLKIVNQTVAPGLRTLGYDEAEICRMLAYIDTNDTIEGAPELKPEHVSIFDCAFKAKNGTRSLSYMGHLSMMAACQPFLSGAISKTVNLPETATVEQIIETYVTGWKMGLKAIAIYRDGSKRSAPLSTTSGGNNTKGTSAANDERTAALEAEVAKLTQKLGQPVRRRMPDTRQSLTHKFSIAGHEGYITAGLFEDGTPGEVFVSMSKEGSTIGGLMDTVATLTSLSLQFGVPLESLIKKFSFQRFEPSGFTSNPDIRNATSITDYVFRWLGCQFIDGYKAATSPSAGHSAPEAAPAPAKAATPVVATVAATHSHNGHSHNGSNNGSAVKEALGSGFMDTACSNCGSSRVVRTGACGCCLDCGSSAGCS